MAIKTYAEQLEEVQTAISKILLTGQAYTIAGRVYTRANLEVLVSYEKTLRQQAVREENGGGIISYRGVPWR